MITSEIPYMLDEKCGQVSAQDVARKMQNGDLQYPSEAGKCRFCNRMLPATHVDLDLGLAGQVEYPVLQCDRVTKLYDQACAIHDRRQKEMMQKLKDQQQNQTKKYEI